MSACSVMPKNCFPGISFLGCSHQGAQEASVTTVVGLTTLPAVVDLGISTWCWFYKVTQASTISVESLGGQRVPGRVESLWAAAK